MFPATTSQAAAASTWGLTPEVVLLTVVGSRKCPATELKCPMALSQP